MRIAPGIFRQYDVRGVIGEDLTADTAAAIGRGFAALLERRGVCVAPVLTLSLRGLAVVLWRRSGSHRLARARGVCRRAAGETAERENAELAPEVHDNNP